MYIINVQHFLQTQIGKMRYQEHGQHFHNNQKCVMIGLPSKNNVLGSGFELLLESETDDEIKEKETANATFQAHCFQSTETQFWNRVTVHSNDGGG
jgi:hypothetical protein